MQTLAIDIETYSSTDLIKSGVYKYVEAPDFEIMLFAYSFDDGPVVCLNLHDLPTLPTFLIFALIDPEILKTAHNANFEITCIKKKLCPNLNVAQWQCTQVKSSMLGLPHSLDAVSKVLKLTEQKSAAGKALIRYFSLPCKPTKVNGMRTRNMPYHNPEKWEEFKSYCVQDVVVEKAIRNKIAFFTIPDKETKLWQLDQKINSAGVLLDPLFVNNAITLDVVNRERLTKKAIELTGLSNPNSATQLKKWLSEETDTEVTSLTKEAVPELLKRTDCKIVTEVLNIRSEMSKTSVKKYTSMVNCICRDNRTRGLLQYYGANRTGRWAGRLIQVQNLPKNSLKDLDLARQLVREGDLEMVEMLFGNVPDTLSQLIRTAFVAPDGHTFIVSDLSAIEARVIAWLANEKWRLDVFNTHGKIYEASASQMFKVPMENVTKGSDYRFKGKISELALGYQGGPGALVKMGGLKMGLVEDELQGLVDMWRHANPAIVKLWYTIGEAALRAVVENISVQIMYGIRFSIEKNILFIDLPSKRRLAYLRPKIKPNRFGNDALMYEGMDQTTKQWCTQETYGGKLTENIVQAIARDVLSEGLLKIDAAGYKLVMHVHDEVVAEVPDDQAEAGLKEVNEMMSTQPSWGKGLPLGADGYLTKYYKKD